MSKKLIAPVLLSVLAIFLFSVVSAHAGSGVRTPSGATLVTVSSVPAASIMAASLLQVPSTSTAAASKKKAVAPEPPTSLYVLGAILLVVVIERKALRALFHSSTSK